MAIDHTNCTHERTPAGRRACRALHNQHMDGRALTAMMNTPVPEITPAPVRRAKGAALQAKLNAMADTPVRLTGAQARKIARHAAKADNQRANQPKRRARKVADDGSGCVQAALHTGRGRCACGWDTMTCTRCGNTDSSCRPGYCHYALSN